MAAVYPFEVKILLEAERNIGIIQYSSGNMDKEKLFRLRINNLSILSFFDWMINTLDQIENLCSIEIRKEIVYFPQKMNGKDNVMYW